MIKVMFRSIILTAPPTGTVKSKDPVPVRCTGIRSPVAATQSKENEKFIRKFLDVVHNNVF